MKKCQVKFALFVGILFMGNALSARAQDDPAARLERLEREIAELKKAHDKTSASKRDEPTISHSNGRFTLTSADGNNSIALRAIVQADAAYYDQDEAGPLTTDYRRGSIGSSPNRENTAARDLSDSIYFRRARFGFEGVLARDFGYRIMVELGGAGTEGQGRINAAWLAYNGFSPLSFQLGAFSPPSNLEDGMSVTDTLFLERSTASEISRALGGADGRIGFGVRSKGRRWMGAMTFTTRTVAEAEVYDAQRAFVGRAAYLALTTDDANLHVGVNGTYILHPADQGVNTTGTRYGVRLRDRPELRVDSTRLIDTGTLAADHAFAAGLELAGNWRNFYAQAENFWYGIDRPSGTDARFGGYYFQGSWIVTGEARRYNMNTASYQAPRPSKPFGAEGGTGAWELGLRFSSMDLNDNVGLAGTAPVTNSVRGGKQEIWTAGVNWYAISNVRLSLEFLHVDVDRLNPASVPGNPTPFGAPPATPPIGVRIGQSYNAVAMRTQFSF